MYIVFIFIFYSIIVLDFPDKKVKKKPDCNINIRLFLHRKILRNDLRNL